jgi:predicted ATP-binding protein involved in virulence
VQLTRFAADNLLSFRHVDLELDTGLTVIVGPNGSGKTNLVRVLMLAGLVLEWLEDRGSHLPGPQGRIFSRLQAIALDPENSVAAVSRIAATYEDV